MTESNEPSRAPGRPAAYQRWLAEMKRRMVFRVIAVYGAVSFIVLEAADLIFPAIPLPAWTVSLVLWMAILGFPVAVVLAWAFELTPEGVRRTQPAAPNEIDSLVSAPAQARWRPGLLALGGMVLLAITFYGGRRSAPPPAGPTAAPGSEAGRPLAYVPPSEDPRPAIAVLPFADMSPDHDQAYFSDGISEEILTVLTRIRDLRVAARTSAFQYRDREIDMRQVGEELGVPYLLGGSVRKDGDQVRISAELVSTADGFRMWAQTFDRRLDNIFAIQTEIAEAIAEALRVPLGLSRDALASPTMDVVAHDLYLSARAEMRRRGTGVEEAVGLFQAAVDRDPLWAPAWAGLAEGLALSPLYAVQGDESQDSTFWATRLEEAATAARRALELDPRSASAQVALGSTHRDRWEWEDAERELLRAIELDPDSEEAHTQYAELLWGMGRMDEALRESGRALAIDRAPIRLDTHGFVLYMNGRPSEAEAMLEEGLAIDTAGDVLYLRSVLGHMMLFDGRFREALERFGWALGDTVGYRRMGEALEVGDPAFLPATAGRGLAQALVVLGEEDRALDELERMVFGMPFRVQYDVWDPLLAPLWSTGRFQNVILPRLGLEGAHRQAAGPS